MDISLQVIKENADGSADAVIHFDKEGLECLIQEGILSILKQYIEQNKTAKDGQKLRTKLNKMKKESK